MITLRQQKLKMNKITLIKELEKYSVFNLKILREITKKNSNYVKLLAYRLKKENHVFEIEKNKYSVHKNPFIISSNIIWPSYMSCWSALRYYNLTEQLPQTIFVITTKSRKKKVLKINDSKVIFIKVLPKFFFGYDKENYNGSNIFIAKKEKALIDSALFKTISFSEISSIIKEKKEEIDTDLLIDYLIKIKSKTLIKRFGFLLDKIKIDKYNQLKRFVDYKYIPLDYALNNKGRKNKKWRVIENVEL